MLDRKFHSNLVFVLTQTISDSILCEKDEEIKNVLQEKENKLQRFQQSLDESTMRVNDLAKQNGVLRAEQEKLKVDFNGKERNLNRQLTKAKKELEQNLQIRLLLILNNNYDNNPPF